jgi:hypothetical protein
MLPDSYYFEPSFHWNYVESSPLDVAQCPLYCRIFASTRSMNDFFFFAFLFINFLMICNEMNGIIQVLLVFALMLTFGGTNYICALWCFWHRSKLPQGETVSELLDATAMVESPQRRSLLSPERLPPNG